MKNLAMSRPATSRSLRFALQLFCAVTLPGALPVISTAAPSKGDAVMKDAMEIHLEVVEAQRRAGQWSVLVELSFHNRGTAVFELDREAAIAAPRELSNHLFDVRQGDKKIDYIGMMKKRAPPGPKGFVRIAAGATYKVTTQIASNYAFPTGGGEFSVALDVHNHFSKDDIDLKSNVAHFTLTDSPSK